MFSRSNSDLHHAVKSFAEEIVRIPNLIELQLAHAERNKVRAAYNRAERLAERRQMMQAWADYLDGLKAKAEVIPLFKRA